MKSRIFSYGFIMFMAVLFATFLATKARAQTTIQASVGTSFAINDYGTTQAAPAIQGRIGYTAVANDATRLNLFGGYELRQLRTTQSYGPKSTYSANDQKVHLGAGIELGDKFRLGLNIGVQANPDKRQTDQGNTRFSNKGGFTEGTLSFTKADKKGNSATGGFSIRAERTLKASNYFDETLVGKNTGIITTSFFIRQNFGGRKKGDNISSKPINVGSSSTITNIQFMALRDQLLKDSIFGTVIVQSMQAVSGNAAKGAMYLAIDSARTYTDLSIAQLHSKVNSELSTQVGNLQKGLVPASYNNIPQQPGAYKHVFPIFYDNGISKLTVNQQVSIKAITTGAATNTKFVISSFSSDAGGLSFNEGLTQARAVAIQNYLKSLGFKGPFEIRQFPSQGGNDGNRQSLLQW